MNKNEVFVSADKLRSFIKNILLKTKVNEDVAGYVAEGLVQTSLRGVDSHGIRLFPHYLEGVKKGRINPNPKYKFERTTPSTGMFDADHTFGHAAGMEAAKKAVELANEAGTGHIAVYNSSHFGAAAYYALEIAKHDMIGMSFTNTDALVKTYAGKRAFLGNNPFCAVVPLADEEPFCLDMATSIITFNKVKQHRENNLPLPDKVAADSNGYETTNAEGATTLLPIGKYKGYGLSMFIEILCSLFTGMPYGPHIPKMFEAPMTEKRYLGHFIIAMRIDCFQDKDTFKERMSLMVSEIRNEPAMDKDIPIQVPGEPEKAIAKKRGMIGIPIENKLMKEFVNFGKDYNINFPYKS